MSLLSSPLRKVKRQLQHLSGYLPKGKSNEIERKTDFSQCARPVLLIYGFMATRRTFGVLERRLRRDGYCVWSVRLGGLFDAFNSNGIDALAEHVSRKIERMYARFPMGPLSIIGHSKGGLIGEYYMKRLSGDRRAKFLLTLGTPHQGTPIAYLGCLTMGLVSKSIWQMTPVSPFVRRLSETPFPENVRVTSIYSKADSASPYPCCEIQTAQRPELRNIEVENVAHRQLLLDRRVYQTIRQELAAAYPSAR
jgi:triacylglycerol esterase/lipase EstA (alpha/beta hydrolase family)